LLVKTKWPKLNNSTNKTNLEYKDKTKIKTMVNNKTSIKIRTMIQTKEETRILMAITSMIIHNNNKKWAKANIMLR
jgi:hypothetical protein